MKWRPLWLWISRRFRVCWRASFEKAKKICYERRFFYFLYNIQKNTKVDRFLQADITDILIFSYYNVIRYRFMWRLMVRIIVALYSPAFLFSRRKIKCFTLTYKILDKVTAKLSNFHDFHFAHVAIYFSEPLSSPRRSYFKHVQLMWHLTFSEKLPDRFTWSVYFSDISLLLFTDIEFSSSSCTDILLRSLLKHGPRRIHTLLLQFTVYHLHNIAVTLECLS